MMQDTTQSGTPIEFWFDFASGYAYFAALDIDAMAQRNGRTVLWRPFTLGAAFKVTGAKGLSRTSLKREYAWRDWQRIARGKDVPFNLPAGHPLTGLPAIRAVYHVEQKDANAAPLLAKDIILRYFREGLNIDEPQAIANLAHFIGFEPEFILAGINDPQIKALARAHCDQAIARGVFGSPWIFVDDEPFWGYDRLSMAEQWLTEGPW
jgi:2-hydroxychromene-2-carboxylate isomerase